jgi:glycine/D-amino acid oxidase-like deaminating enzyme
VVEHFVGEGGEYLCAEARPNAAQNGRLIVSLHTGNILPADAYVFACGPWLGLLFPDVLGNFIRPTRQDVVFVGTPPGSTCFGPIELPCWIDRTSRLTFYGIPECEHRGLKIASDVRGPDFNPSTGDRIAAAAWRDAQAYLTHRFPDLARAPLIETRVCQYEDSQDVAFILDRHPGAENVWLVGGGSGHGYKHGPAVGELVADLVTGRQSPPAEFSLARFASGAPRQSRVSTIYFKRQCYWVIRQCDVILKEQQESPTCRSKSMSRSLSSVS